MASVRIHRRYTRKEIKKVELLRKKGLSYSQIGQITRVPKSTLSTWFSNKPKFRLSPEARNEQLKRARDVSIAYFKKRREDKLELVRNEIAKEFLDFPVNGKEFKKCLLAMLYWAEGAKSDKHWGVRFANTDPELCKLFIRLLRDCFPIQEDRIRVKLYLHYYHPIRESKKFWADSLGLQIKQFEKIYIKKRSVTKRFRKNFKGICFINYPSNDLKKEFMELAYAVKDKVLSL